jgi:hypothetical protein
MLPYVRVMIENAITKDKKNRGTQISFTVPSSVILYMYAKHIKCITLSTAVPTCLHSICLPHIFCFPLHLVHYYWAQTIMEWRVGLTFGRSNRSRFFSPRLPLFLLPFLFRFLLLFLRLFLPHLLLLLPNPQLPAVRCRSLQSTV